MEMIADFIRRKHGMVEVHYPHPVLEEILKETYGVIVYQEQVMQIASKMAGFSLGEADVLRKAMGKKNASAMQSMKPKFVDGAKKNKIPGKIALQVFDLMKQFAQYGFNKSHSTAYALLAYQTAYLKVHFPVQFMAALLSSEIGNTEKIVMYIAECKDMGIPVLPPDINESELHFLSTAGKIRFGMLAIRNVGEGAIRSMLHYHKQHGRFNNIFHFCEEVDSRAVNKRVLESLIKSGALDSLGCRRAQLMAMADAAIEHGQKVQRDRESGQRGLFSDLIAGQAALSEPTPPDIPEWSPEQLLAFEKETLGYYVSGHPLDHFADDLSKFSKKSLADLIGDGESVECKVAGIVADCRTLRTKKGDLMATFTLEDLTGAVEAVAFPSVYAKFGSLLCRDIPVLVGGRFEVEDENSFKLVAFDLQELAGIGERNAKTLRICAEVKNLAPDAAGNLCRLFDQNRGETGVEVQLYHRNEFRVTIQSSDFVRVKSSPDLIRRIEDICGLGSVQVMH